MVSGSAGSGALARRLTTTDAVTIGLGSMIGAGVFAVFAPAAAAAGAGLLIGLAIAAIVAFCNATASAQLAAEYPSSGGSYLYGRERLGEWPGFLAGWTFVVGKTASCAAMALTFAAYTAPAPWQKPVAVVAVVLLATVNLFGVTRTALVTRILVVSVLVVLVTLIAIASGHVASAGGASAGGAGIDVGGVVGADPYGILQSAGLLFFAFAGYARVATMGEEVKNPARAIPRAITISLSAALVLYCVLAVLLLWVLGPAALAASTAPLVTLTDAIGAAWLIPAVQVAAALAALGALLALIAGIGRTSLAMARNGDLPRGLAAIHPASHVPYRAEIALAVAVCILVLAVDVRQAIGFSAFGVLLYYFVANVAAFTQTPQRRRYPRVLQVVGAVGCLTLVATLPWQSVVGGVAVVAVGVVYRAVHLRLEARAAGAK